MLTRTGSSLVRMWGAIGHSQEAEIVGKNKFDWPKTPRCVTQSHHGLSQGQIVAQLSTFRPNHGQRASWFTPWSNGGQHRSVGRQSPNTLGLTPWALFRPRPAAGDRATEQGAGGVLKKLLQCSQL